MPALCALSGCSIFIASSTTTRSPSATCVAVRDRDLDDRALHRGGQRVAADAAPPPLALRRRAASPAPRRPGRPTAPRPAGSVTSSRLPPTSTMTVSRAGALLGLGRAGSKGRGCCRTRSRSTGCARRTLGSAVERRVASRPPGGTAARWPCPRPRTRPARRRARSSACCRVAPVTMSLASSESNAPPITEPASTPASTPHARDRPAARTRSPCPARAGSRGPGPRR